MHFRLFRGEVPAPPCRLLAASVGTARRPRWGARSWGCFVGLVMLGGGGAWAQESLRVSLAGADAAKAKREKLEKEKYNIELGPVGLRLSTGLEVEANDNVKATSTNLVSDLIFRPQMGVSGAWRVTDKNTLNLGMGVGYWKYLHDTEPDNYFITPGSDVSFDLWIGDFNIDLHSRFSYSQDATTDPTASGIGSLNRFEATSGFRVKWDLNAVVLATSYDYVIYKATQSEFSYLSHVSHLVSVSAALRINPTFFAGLEVGGGMTDYDDNEQVLNGNNLNNNTHLAAGPFFDLQVNEYTAVRLGGGYTVYDNKDQGTTTNASTISGFYFDLRIRQRVNHVLSHALSAGREVQSGFGSSTYEMLYVRDEATWRLFEKTAVTTSFSYENIPASSSGGNDEAIDRYGFGLKLSRPITLRTSASLSYQFYSKTSSVSENDYVQNRLVLNLGYSF